MIDTAHEHGIRIVLDVVLNHPGYNSIYDMNEYQFGTLTSNWKSVYYNWNGINQSNYHGCIKYNDGDANQWANWWGRDWIRAGMAGYDNNGSGDLTGAVTYLPDFKTENTATVSLPKILQNKWTKEGTYNAKVQEIDQTFSKYNLGNKTVLNYLVSWYAKWVEEYGIDGFRCDTAKHVDTSCWKKLNDACTKALQNWRKDNPNAVGANWDEDFWMTGENFGQGVDNNHYYQNGFDSMINFSFSGDSQGNGCNGMKKVGNLNQTYADYANQINNNANFNVLTYISSHDTGLCRDDLYYQGSALLLLPGGVQIYYGDETNRQYVECSIHDHESRSFMNWSNADKGILAHWQKVGSFRNDHVAVGAGSHANLSATSGTAFSRTYNKNNVKDTVVCVIGANKNTSTTITLNGAFADGAKVVNAYTGDTATVAGGKVTVNSGAQGTILLELDAAPVVPTTTVPQTTVKPTTAPTTAPVVTTAPKTEPSETKPVVTTAPKTEPTETTPAATTAPIITKPTTQATQPTTTKPAEPAEYVILGDVDGSGKVNIKDATLIQKHIAKLETLDEKAIFAGNVDGSDALNIRDVTTIQKWVAKLDVEYAIGEEVLYKGSEESTTPKPTGSPIIIPTTTAEPTEVPTTKPTEAPTTAPKTEPTEAPTTAAPTTPAVTETQPIVTEPTTVTTPVITEPITQPNDGTETIYFVDGTPEGWIGDADAKIYIFNYETNENYAGTMQDENTWTFQVPAGMTAINFYRCEGEFTQTAWNSWTMCVTVRGSENTFTATSNEAGSWTGSSSGGNNGGYTPPVDNPPADGDYIYFTDNAGWGTVYCHTWNLVGATNTPWPGDQMENVGGNQYRLLVDSTHTHLKFNNGNGVEGQEFELTIGNTYSN